MNILHLQTELDYCCGVAKVIFLLASNMPDNTNHVLCLKGNALSKFASKGIQVKIIESNKISILSTLKLLFVLGIHCRDKKIDIIHSHHRYFDFLAYVISFFIRVHTITSVHSKVSNYRFLSYKAAKLIVVGNSIKTHVEKKFGRKLGVEVINNFIDEHEIVVTQNSKVLKEKLGIHQSIAIIGFIGRISIREKGVDILMESFRLLNIPDVMLLLVGNGEDELFVQGYIRDYKLNALYLSSKSDVYNYYNICDIMILPSRIEPFSVSLLEIGYLKKPLIASRVDGIPEVINDGINGLLFESGNVKQLCSILSLLIFDKNYQIKLGNNLHKKIMEQYTCTKIIPQYYKLYSEIISNGK